MINDINPVLFVIKQFNLWQMTIGPVEIRYYGLIYALGFLIGYLFLRKRIKNKRLKLSYDNLDIYFLWLVIGVIIGARLFEIIFFSWNYYSTHPIEMLMIWNGGLSFHGGLVGSVLVTYWFCKKYKINFYDIADSLVIPAAIALAFGRIANFINSEHYGKIVGRTVVDATKDTWCVVFKRNPEAMLNCGSINDCCRHPSQLYESLTNFIEFGILMFYDSFSRKKNSYRKGTLFWMFIVMYGALRFVVNFFRDDPSYQFFIGISVGQWLSIFMVVVGAVFLLQYSCGRNKNIKKN